MLTRRLLTRLQSSIVSGLRCVTRFSTSVQTADIGITNGTIVNSDRKFVGNVYIKDGQIVSVVDKSDDAICLSSRKGITNPCASDWPAKRMIDAEHKMVMPGGLDPHTHLQLPFMGTCAIDDFEYGSRAALCGGTTCHIDFVIPAKDQSLLDAYHTWRSWADTHTHMDYAFHGGITHWDESVHKDMGILVNEYGVTSFKLFLAYEGLFMLNDRDIIAVMKRAKELGAMVLCHAENGYLITDAQQRIFEEFGIAGPEGHQLSRPPEFEAEATHRAMVIANYVNTPLYVVHVQSVDAARMIQLARQKGYNVFGENVAACFADGSQLWNTEFDTAAGYVMSPPIAVDARHNQQEMINMIASGTISTIGTDNCTFTTEQKKRLGFDDFRKIPNGVNGIEDRMSVVYNACVHNGHISPQKFVEITSTNAAKIFNLYPQKGRIDVGCDADVVVWDAQRSRVISAATHHHRGDFNVFEGMEVYGCADVTISNGTVVWENECFLNADIAKQNAKFLHRKPFGYAFETVSVRDEQRKPKAVDRSATAVAAENGDKNAVELMDDRDGQLVSVENVLRKYVKSSDADKDGDACHDELDRIIYGIRPRSFIEAHDGAITANAKQLSVAHDFELQSVKISGKYAEETREPRHLTIGAIQNVYHCDGDIQSQSVLQQKQYLHACMQPMIESAAECGVNVLCLQECWNMPFAFATREKHWTLEFAEYIDEDCAASISFSYIAEMAKQHRMCIISPMLERDTVRDTVHNTAVVFGDDGCMIGKHRKNHIPRIGDFNESTYYMEGDTGHPVFNLSAYHNAKIAVNICYGRHHPLNWMMFGLNGAEVVFNPSATTASLSEHLWNIEARNAAIANNYYTVAINRVGTEVFSKTPFTSGDGQAAHNDFGHFYGSSYITAPNGVRTYPLSRTKDGLLVADIDLNLCRQVKDEWGFQMTARYELYAQKLKEYISGDYQQQIVYDKEPPQKKEK